jgi:thiaminase/transcriptional activator TenA
LRSAPEPIWRAIFGHPVLRQIRDGSLPIERFGTSSMNHMLATAAFGTLGGTPAALLPCPWTYHEIEQRLGPVAHPVSAEWGAFYAAGGLAESVRAWTDLVDRTGAEAGPAEQAAMRQAFLTSSRYDYLFWEVAACQETWPV